MFLSNLENDIFGQDWPTVTKRIGTVLEGRLSFDSIPLKYKVQVLEALVIMAYHDDKHYLAIAQLMLQLITMFAIPPYSAFKDVLRRSSSKEWRIHVALVFWRIQVKNLFDPLSSWLVDGLDLPHHVDNCRSSGKSTEIIVGSLKYLEDLGTKEIHDGGCKALDAASFRYHIHQLIREKCKATNPDFEGRRSCNPVITRRFLKAASHSLIDVLQPTMICDPNSSTKIPAYCHWIQDIGTKHWLHRSTATDPSRRHKRGLQWDKGGSARKAGLLYRGGEEYGDHEYANAILRLVQSCATSTGGSRRKLLLKHTDEMMSSSRQWRSSTELSGSAKSCTAVALARRI